ncbi:MAG: hypothetical protein OEM99_08220 [Gammaproteobacteria bacterium]|nr:hypothetical protein [Gammaproteobacteria bacterium]
MFISVLNQAVSSGTHFLLGLYLVRALTPAEFGLYGIGFAICLFYAGIGNALFLTQMVVNTPDKLQADRLHYAANILMAVMLFGGFTIVCAWLVFLGGELGLPWRGDYAGYGIAVVAASVTYLLKDFFIRHAFTARKEAWALVVSCVVAATLAGLLLFDHYSGRIITAERALWIYAMSQLAGAILGFTLARLPMRSVAWSHVHTDFREAWLGGRWATGVNLAYWLRTQAPIYLTAWYIGPIGVGYVIAAKVLISPVYIMANPIYQVMMPRIVELRNRDRRKMLRISGITTAGLVGFAILYSTALLGAVDIIAPVVLGPQYGQIAPLAAAWSLVLILELARDGAGILFQALKRFRDLMLANAVSAGVAILSAALLLQLVGVPGAVLGVAVGELVLIVLLWRMIRCERS